MGIVLLACNLWFLSGGYGVDDPLQRFSDALMRILEMTPRTVFVAAWAIWTVRIFAFRASVADWQHKAWKIVSSGVALVVGLAIVVLVFFLGPH